ncbi:MAG: hypothetical protein LBE99_01340 [Puniceicoccales bacterium]|jgi:hypothetical protein|nr:hypothetical protein [Puniceicoccales bacterium]
MSSLPSIGSSVPRTNLQSPGLMESMPPQPLSSPCQYIQCPTENQQVVTEYLTKISNLSSGLALLNRLTELTNSTNTTINVTIGEDEAFETSEIRRKSFPNSKMLEINITLSNNMSSMQCPMLCKKSQGGFGVRALNIPYEIAVAHELIHVAHKLEFLSKESDITDASLMSVNRWEGLNSARSALKSMIVANDDGSGSDDASNDSFEMEADPKWVLFLDLFGSTKAFEEYRTMTGKDVNEDRLIDLQFSERHLLSEYYDNSLFYMRWGHFSNFEEYNTLQMQDEFSLVEKLLSQEDIENLPTIIED